MSTSPLAAREWWNWWMLMARMIVPGAAAPGELHLHFDHHGRSQSADDDSLRHSCQYIFGHLCWRNTNSIMRFRNFVKFLLALLWHFLIDALCFRNGLQPAHMLKSVQQLNTRLNKLTTFYQLSDAECTPVFFPRASADTCARSDESLPKTSERRSSESLAVFLKLRGATSNQTFTCWVSFSSNVLLISFCRRGRQKSKQNLQTPDTES